MPIRNRQVGSSSPPSAAFFAQNFPIRLFDESRSAFNPNYFVNFRASSDARSKASSCDE
jgi:hypothetical protein